jgi:TolB-like protein/Tfp pilus assembly protein PilF
MAEERVHRRLAAILAADVVGYSRLMERDEAGTLQALRGWRETVLEPLVAQYGGRIVKLMGDGALVEFPSAVSAVQCATDQQKQMAQASSGLPADQAIMLRVGVNLGDVVVEGGDLYGDGVNVASRLEAMAEPGGTCISGKVHDEVRGKLDLDFEDLGEVALKNLTKPVRVYRVRRDAEHSDSQAVLAASKQSIAVLPFTNMSGDPEQQYFSDGITEDIITELSRFHSLLVIARNSSFQYRDKSPDVKRVGRDLGVEYVVEGSVRKAGNRIRVTAQLIEASTGNHLWAEHYDRDVEDIFAVQDAVTQTVVATLPGRIEEAGARSSRRKQPENLAAYDYLLRGLAIYRSLDTTQTQAARDMFDRAIALDPGLARAYLWLAATEWREWWNDRSLEALDKAYVLVKRAVSLDENDGLCNASLGYLLVERRQFDRAAFHIERAVSLNPNDPTIAVHKGLLLAYTSQPDEGAIWMRKALRLDPFAPQWYQSALSMALYAARRPGEAIAAIARITAELDTWDSVYLVASYGQLGRLEEAQAHIATCWRLHPDKSLLQHAAHEPYKDPVYVEYLLEGLHKAGLPE